MRNIKLQMLVKVSGWNNGGGCFYSGEYPITEILKVIGINKKTFDVSNVSPFNFDWRARPHHNERIRIDSLCWEPLTDDEVSEIRERNTKLFNASKKVEFKVFSLDGQEL